MQGQLKSKLPAPLPNLTQFSHNSPNPIYFPTFDLNRRRIEQQQHQNTFQFFKIEKKTLKFTNSISYGSQFQIHYIINNSQHHDSSINERQF